jgi:putative membrane protein
MFQLNAIARHAMQGFCMGSADIIPGVSGGTMALILGIYERLLEAIRSFDRAWLADLLRLRLTSALARNDLGFLLPLAGGIVLALLFFTRVVPLPRLIVTHPELVYGLFFGLILASVVVLMGEVERYGVREILWALAGTVLGFAIAWFIFLCGFVAISAMLLPGISGSFILLILGKYAYMIEALGAFDVSVILAFVLGALSGLIAFSRAIVWLLHHYHQATLLVIKGILIGSLWVIWPFQDRVYETIHGKARLVSARPVWPDVIDGTVVWGALLAVAGFVLVIVLHRLSARRRRQNVPG